MTTMTLPPRQSDRLVRDLLLPEETLKVRQQAREVAEREVFPHAREIGAREEAVEHFPWAPFRALGAAGLFAVPFAADYGAGLAPRAAAPATVIEELAYVASSAAAIYDGHCLLAGNALAFGSPALKDPWLRPL